MKKNVWNNTEIMYEYVETNTQISEFTRQLVWKFQNEHFPKILQNARKIYYVYWYNSLVVSNHQNSDKTSHHFTLKFHHATIEGLRRGGGGGKCPNIAKVTTFEILPTLRYGI